MRASWLVLVVVLFGIGVLAGCASAPQTMSADGAIMDMDADSAVVAGTAAEAKVAPDGKPYEYRAVCLETSQHSGQAHVMSKWSEDRDVAQKLGDYHGNFKEKGHHWVIERRVKH